MLSTMVIEPRSQRSAPCHSRPPPPPPSPTPTLSFPPTVCPRNSFYTSTRLHAPHHLRQARRSSTLRPPPPPCNLPPPPQVIKPMKHRTHHTQPKQPALAALRIVSINLRKEDPQGIILTLLRQNYDVILLQALNAKVNIPQVYATGRARAKVFHNLDPGRHGSPIVLAPSVAHLAREIDPLDR